MTPQGIPRVNVEYHFPCKHANIPSVSWCMTFTHDSEMQFSKHNSWVKWPYSCECSFFRHTARLRFNIRLVKSLFILMIFSWRWRESSIWRQQKNSSFDLVDIKYVRYFHGMLYRWCAHRTPDSSCMYDTHIQWQMVWTRQSECVLTRAVRLGTFLLSSNKQKYK